MKSNTKYFLMAVVCLYFSCNVLAQKEAYITHPDTLRIDLAEGQSITFAFRNINKIHFDDEFDSAWTASIRKIETILKLDHHREPINVRLINKQIENEIKDVVEVTPIEPKKDIYMSRNGELQNVAKLSHLYFIAKDMVIDVYLQQVRDLRIITELSLEQLEAQLKEQQKNISSPKKAYYLSTKAENHSFTKLNISDSGVTDFLNLSAGIGVGLFRDKLAPEIAINADITLGSKHGIKLHKFGVQSSFHYFFDRNADKSYDMHVNTFITAFYKRNFSKSTLTDRWGGIGIGYLAKSAGGYFEKNTFKGSIFINPNHSDISIVPEIIISDDFKTVFPSLRFGLTF